MTQTQRFQVGDVVRDTIRAAEGEVWKVEAGVLDLQNDAGYTWRALAHRCNPTTVADASPQFPPGTKPESVTPADIRVGDWVPLDGRNYRIVDMRSNGPGGRILIMDGYPRPWVMTPGPRQVYRPIQ